MSGLIPIRSAPKVRLNGSCLSRLTGFLLTTAKTWLPPLPIYSLRWLSSISAISVAAFQASCQNSGLKPLGDACN